MHHLASKKLSGRENFSSLWQRKNDRENRENRENCDRVSLQCENTDLSAHPCLSQVYFYTLTDALLQAVGFQLLAWTFCAKKNTMVH